MSINVGVIDYGMGNIHSVAKALASQGGRVVVTDNIEKLKKSHLLVLPGVGAFGAAMATLARKKLDVFVKNWIREDKPYLGICLGFQLLFDSSEESPGVKGLGVLKGPVVRFREKDFGKKPFNIPHMGWNTAEKTLHHDGSLFYRIKNKDHFYFVHTFFPQPEEETLVATETLYGKKFCSSVLKGNLFASQFHPEKSGTIGLILLKNIIQKVKK